MSEMMDLTFEAPVGTRLHKRFEGITQFTKDDLWWDAVRRKWSPLHEIKGVARSNAPCRSLKAFRRHLRRHAGELAGCEVVLASRFIGYNVWCDLRGHLATTAHNKNEDRDE